MNLLACLCCKHKDKAQVSVRNTTSVEPTQSPFALNTNPSDIKSRDEETEDQASKLEIIRTQLKEAQQHQAPNHRQPVLDQVIGVVDIPVYETNGQSLKSNGKTYQMFVYDK